MPPKKAATQQAKKPAGAAPGAGAAASKSKAPIDKTSLITTATSPMIVKKAFSKLATLFRALSAELDQPLPPKVKAEVLSRAGFEALSKKLSHAVTKYVIFVCQEGSISTIESQTQILLNVIRSVCVAIRAKFKDSGLTLQISLAETGTNLLDLLTALMTDLSAQVSLEWKKCLDADGKFQSPLNQDSSQIVQITARIWSACEQLGSMPLTDKEAITIQAKNYAEMMKDALNEIKQVKEGEHEFPIEDDETKDDDAAVEEETDVVPDLIEATPPPTATTTTTEDGEQAPTPPTTTLVTTTAPVIEPDGTLISLENDIAIADQFITDDLDYSPDEVSKSEFVWLKSAKNIITLATGIISTVTKTILPAMTHPATVGDEINLKIPGALNEKKQFVFGLERRLKDLEKMAYYTDMLCNHLYTPQNIPLASKYAWFILSKLSRLLTWLDVYQVNGWFKSSLGSATGGMIFALETDASRTETAQACTASEQSKVFVTHSWWRDPLINPCLRPIVVAKNNEYITKTKSGPQYNRLHEFDTINPNLPKPQQKIPLISKWKWINFQRKELFLALYQNTQTDGKNVALEHFKLSLFRFPIPQDKIDAHLADPKSKIDDVTTLPVYNYDEDTLLDDKEDMEPDGDDLEDDDDEDWDEDDDFGLFSDDDGQ